MSINQLLHKAITDFEISNQGKFHKLEYLVVQPRLFEKILVELNKQHDYSLIETKGKRSIEFKFQNRTFTIVSSKAILTLENL